jgi:hypothetical protein
MKVSTQLILRRLLHADSAVYTATSAKMRITKRTSCRKAFHDEYVIQCLRVQFSLKSHDTFYVILE